MTPDEIRQATEAIATAHVERAVETAELMLGELEPMERHSLRAFALDNFNTWLAAIRDEAKEQA